jgi:hypothetical protein
VTAVKLQSRRNGGAKADRIIVFHKFVDEHMTQHQIARCLGCSDEAVRKQKIKLLDAGYIVEIGTSGLFERGPNAKFFEAAAPVVQTVKEPAPETKGSVQPPRNGGAVEGGTVAPPSGERDAVAWVPTIEAHMKDGGVIFPVEKVGRITSYLRPTEDGGTAEVPFLEETISGRNSLWQYDGDITLPGQAWSAHLQLQVFIPKKKPRHAHLRIFPPRLPLTVEEAEAGASYPFQFFEKEVFAILDHIEKFAGWRFARKAGRRVGRKDGKVEYAMRLPEEVKRIVPPNLHGIEGVDCHIDESPGKGKHEIEAENLARITAMIKAKEGFERVDAALEEVSSDVTELQTAIEAREREVLQLRYDILGREMDIWEAISGLVDMQHHAVNAVTVQAHLDAARRGIMAEPQDPAVAAVDTDARKGGMYQ